MEKILLSHDSYPELNIYKNGRPKFTIYDRQFNGTGVLKNGATNVCVSVSGQNHLIC